MNDRRQEQRVFNYDLWSRVLLSMIGLGFVVVGVLGATGNDDWRFGLVAALLLAGVAGVSGGFFGFLFAIPRAQPIPDGAVVDGGPSGRRYNENTNLEQISDCLTKILIGITLTQFASLKDLVVSFSRLYAPSFLGATPGPTGTAICVAAIAYFFVAGFLCVYLWTRLYMEGALRVAGADTNARLREMMQAEQRETNETDSRAIDLVDDFLDARNDAAKFDPAEVRRTVAEASYLAKTMIFDKAKEVRAASWRVASTKHLLERTIPIFEGLIEGAPNRSHRYYGQLAFALKDKVTPDWSAAESLLRKAIALRSDDDNRGAGFYEFNLAVCLVNLDPEFRNGKASEPPRQHEICALIKRGATVIDPRSEPTLLRWMTLNSISVQDFEKEAPGG
jgi:hypothetical protein